MKNISRSILYYLKEKRGLSVATTIVVWIGLFYLLLSQGIISFIPIKAIFVKGGRYFIEPLFHSFLWSKFLGQNTMVFILTFICAIIISWPLGYLILDRIFSGLFKSEEKIFLSIPIGFLSNIVIWTFLILWFGRYNTFLYIGATILLSCGLLLVKKRDKLANNGTERISLASIILPSLIILYGIATFNNIFKDVNVPFSWDSMTTCYFDFIIRGEKTYPLIHPYTGLSTSYFINYPPSFNIVVVLFSSILSSVPLTIIHMGVTMCCFVLIPLSLFYIIKDITQNYLIPFFISFLSISGAFIYSTWQSNFPEDLSILSAVVFILILGRMFLYYKSDLKRVKYFCLIVSGMLFSVSMLSNTKVFQIYLISFMLFAFILYITSGPKKEILSMVGLIAIGMILISAPWFFYMIKNSVIGQLSDKLYWWPVLNLWRLLLHRNSLGYICFSIAGLLCSVYYLRKNRIILFAFIFTIVAIIMIRHDIIFSIFSPKWFSYKSISYSTKYPYFGGADKLFSSKFLIYVYEISHYGFTVVAPILIATFAHSVYLFFGKFSYEKINKLFLAVLIFLIAMNDIHRIPGGAGVLLPDQDYRVLRELSKRTRYDDTLVLNPWHGSYREGNWAPCVAERKTIFFRYGSYFIRWKEEGVDREKLKWIYNNIDQQGNVGILRGYGITHVYLPTSAPIELKEKYDRIFTDRIEYTSDNRRAAIYEL